MMDGGTEPTGVLMISALKEKGLWTYREPAGDCRTDLADREKQWYERNYNLLTDSQPAVLYTHDTGFFLGLPLGLLGLS